MKVENKTFEKFFSQYKSRYGETRMNAETMDMWWNKLGTFENDPFIKASEALLGSEKTSFGWKVLRHAILALNQGFDDQHSKLEKEWKLNQDHQKNHDKKRELTRVMNRLLDKAKSKTGYSKWREEYAVEFVRIWGPKEAYQIAANVGKDPTFRDFASIVFNILREKGK